MAVNQKQIAERLGVSIAVVSRSLSGTARDIGISEETIERVKETAREMGYVPNVAAQTLKGKSSNTIGVVVYDFLDPFFGTMLEYLQRVAHEEGYSLVLVGFQGRHPDESDLTPLRKHVIDGLIVLGSTSGSDWLDDFRHLSVARVGHGAPGEQSVCVKIDEQDAAGQLLEHLKSIGFSKGLFIGSQLYVRRLRYEAFERAAAALDFQIENMAYEEDGFVAGLRTVESLLAEGREATALICATDMIAMGALHALHDEGAHWPVTGFDDIPAAAQFMPSITTIRQPAEEISRQVIAAIANELPPADHVLPGSLVIRESTGGPF